MSNNEKPLGLRDENNQLKAKIERLQERVQELDVARDDKQRMVKIFMEAAPDAGVADMRDGIAKANKILDALLEPRDEKIAKLIMEKQELTEFKQDVFAHSGFGGAGWTALELVGSIDKKSRERGRRDAIEEIIRKVNSWWNERNAFVRFCSRGMLDYFNNAARRIGQ